MTTILLMMMMIIKWLTCEKVAVSAVKALKFMLAVQGGNSGKDFQNFVFKQSTAK